MVHANFFFGTRFYCFNISVGALSCSLANQANNIVCTLNTNDAPCAGSFLYSSSTWL